MTVRCLVCKTELEPPPSLATQEALLVCPECGFIGLWDGARYSIPTHQEEAALERVTAKVARTVSSSDGEATEVDSYAADLPLPYKRQLFLKVLTGPRAGELLRLDKGRVVLGRNEADVTIEDAKVSRKHAAIEAISRENIFLRDLASTNGTYLNGTRIRSKKLRNGDIVRVGSTELQFLWQDEE